MSHKIAIVGIGTEIGKTIVSSIACVALQASYWKPIQTGYLQGKGDRDSRIVKKYANCKIYPESYLLQQPLSPHIAAEIDGVEIEKKNLKIPPQIQENLIIETAGGLMVPLNSHELYMDILQDWNIPTILTVGQYLGNINHTILSIEALKTRNIKIWGFVSNGDPLPDTNEWLESYSKTPCLLQIPKYRNADEIPISSLANELKSKLIHHGLV